MLRRQFHTLTIADVVDLAVRTQIVLVLVQVGFFINFCITQGLSGNFVHRDGIGLAVFSGGGIGGLFALGLGVPVLFGLLDQGFQFILFDGKGILVILFVGHGDIRIFDLTLDRSDFGVPDLLPLQLQNRGGRGGDQTIAVHFDKGDDGVLVAVFVNVAVFAGQGIGALFLARLIVGVHQFGDVFRGHLVGRALVLFQGQGLLVTIVLDVLDHILGIADLLLIIGLYVPGDLRAVQFVLDVDVTGSGLGDVGLLLVVSGGAAGSFGDGGIGARGQGRRGDGGVSVLVRAGNAGAGGGRRCAGIRGDRVRRAFIGFVALSAADHLACFFGAIGFTGLAGLVRTAGRIGFAGLVSLFRFTGLIGIFLADHVTRGRDGTGLFVLRGLIGVVLDVHVIAERFLDVHVPGRLRIRIQGFIFDLFHGFFRRGRSLGGLILFRGGVIGDRTEVLRGIGSQRLCCNTGRQSNRHGRKFQFFVCHDSSLLSHHTTEKSDRMDCRDRRFCCLFYTIIWHWMSRKNKEERAISAHKPKGDRCFSAQMTAACCTIERLCCGRK